jgi:hypothetical protein
MKGQSTTRESRSPVAQPAEAMLIMFDAESQMPRQSWSLGRPVTTIGRWDDNDVAIPDRWVSRHHAQIHQTTGEAGRVRYEIVDLDSKNGLFVNGKRLTKPAVLEDGDQVQISPHHTLTFVDSEATAPFFQGQSGVRIDDKARRVWVRGQELDPSLSSAQYTLLTTLIGAPERVFSHDELVCAIWPDEDPSGISDEALNSLVRRLRRRLMDLDPENRYIVAVRGHGVKFEKPT